jgi:hypothetical protein
MEAKKKKKRTRKSKTTPPVALKSDVTVSLSVSATLTRSAAAMLTLMSWAEGALQSIADGKVEVSVALVDSILKTVAKVSDKLPKIQRELAKAQKAEVAPDSLSDRLANDADVDERITSAWDDVQELEFLQEMVDAGNLEFCTEYLADPSNSPDLKEKLRTLMESPRTNDTGVAEPKLEMP